jgi:hypothetical protein
VTEPVAEVTPPYGRCHAAYRENVSVAGNRTEKVWKVHGDVLHRHLRAGGRQCGRRAEGSISCAAAVGSRSECWRAGELHSRVWCLTWHDVEGNCVELCAGTDRSSFRTGDVSLQDGRSWYHVGLQFNHVFFRSIGEVSGPYMHSPFVCLVPPKMPNLIFLHIPRQHPIQVRLTQIPLVPCITFFLIFTQPFMSTHTF